MRTTRLFAWIAALGFLLGLAPACEKAKTSPQAAGAEPPAKTIVMPVKPLTEGEKSMLLKAAKGFVETAQAKEPKAYADIDWSAVGFKRMGIYFHVKVEKQGHAPHSPAASIPYVFRVGGDYRNVVDLGTR